MTKKYIPLHVHSNASTLDGLSSPEDIAKRIVKLGLDGCALTDHATVAGVPSFFRAMADACGTCGNVKNSHADNGAGRCVVPGETCSKYTKNELKAIAGCEFNVVPRDASIQDETNRKYSHLCVLAKNKEGWKGLIRAVSLSNDPTYHYYKPRLDLDRLAPFAGNGNWQVFMGHPGSTIADLCFTDHKAAYRAKTYDEVKSFVKEWESLKIELKQEINRYIRLFGKENISLEVQLLDAENIIAAQVLAKIMRWLGEEMGIRLIATPDAHYCRPEDASDQRVLLCMSLATTLRDVERAAANGDDVMLGGFFKSSNYYIPSDEELKLLNTQDELDNTRVVMESCEAFSLSGMPRLPKFKLPDGFNDDFTYLKFLCEKGWKEVIEGTVPENLHDKYRERLNMELGVVKELIKDFDLHLDTYFLIVADIVKYSVDKLGCYVPPGRGCFLPDSRVKMSDGTFTPIALVKRGDLVVDAFGKEQKVYDILEYDVDEELLEVEFENNKIIRCTKDHKFLTNNRGWVEAKDLDEFDDIAEV